MHWDGSDWVGVASGITANLNGVWGTGSTDVLAVGSYGTMVRWNGLAWDTVMNLEAMHNDLEGVWGSGRPNDIWAVGKIAQRNCLPREP
jgi:hypothetical protein